MKRLIVGVAAALLLSAGPAAADGLPSRGTVRAPAAATGPNWNGFYIGAGIGAGAVVHDLTISEHHDTVTLDGIGGEGIFGTVTIGYDRVIRPDWVAGVFADYDFSNIRSRASDDWDSGSLDHRNSWSIGARLGMLTSPSTLVYATGGYTQAEFNVSDGFNDVLFDEHGGNSQTFQGYFVGAGIETFLRQDWTLKLEYRFSQFDKENIIEYCPTVDLEPSMHTARLVLSYKFGH
jgi:outer membrane immunogenic protein